MTSVPDGLNPQIQTREIVFDAEVDLVTPFLKLATVSRGGSGPMTFASDEGPNLGGLGSAPTPLMYFSAALDGSVLNDTVQGRMVGAETTLEIESPDPPELVARVVRNAERGCFVMQALQHPVPVTGRTMLNGAPLEASGATR